jgi:hypothetical protein
VTRHWLNARASPFSIVPGRAMSCWGRCTRPTRLDGAPPGRDRGLDIDAAGRGTITDDRLYQLVRQDGPVRDRTVDITFTDAGARAYVLTFG